MIRFLGTVPTKTHHKVDPNKGMENNNIKQSFLNTPIEGDSWKEELREIIRQELLLGNVTPSPLAQKE